ncbi:hypothetical protein [Enterococcus thailandicus]|uniref:hypothetical protein n=1 Tax=Enterococcus thailandicus TaxID=417368 RepID=UPI00372D01B5
MSSEWLQQQIDKLNEKNVHYEDAALLFELKKLVKESDERITQLQGEIDGKSWNHREW